MEVEFFSFALSDCSLSPFSTFFHQRNAALQHIGGSVTCQDVTVEELEKRKQVEAKSEEMFQRVCQTLPQLVWTAEANGSVTWFSESWFEYTGTNSDSSVGISWMDM